MPDVQWDDASPTLEIPPDPPPPQPLLFIPLKLGQQRYAALVYSGASDSFISSEVVRQQKLKTYPLKRPIRVNVANGQSLIVQHYVRLYTRIGNLKIKLFLRVIETPLPIVLGYQFLAWYNPTINWVKRSMQITFGGKTTTVPTVFAGSAITQPETMPNVMP